MVKAFLFKSVILYCKTLFVTYISEDFIYVIKTAVIFSVVILADFMTALFLQGESL